MGKDKLKKWEENKHFPHVFEPPLLPFIKGGDAFFMKGKWRSDFFKNVHPLVLELGCGKGEYTVGLARREPDKNFIGIDVKGHRFHKGAKEAFQEGLQNVAFIRMRVELISSFFAENEVDEIWITFCDPQPVDHVGHRRITSPWYLEHYKKILKPGALLFLKHDNDRVYERALKEWSEHGFSIETHDADVYSDYIKQQSPGMQDVLSIRTYYEQMWLEEGRRIKFIRSRMK